MTIIYFSCYHDSPDPSLDNIIIRAVAVIHKLRAEGFMISSTDYVDTKEAASVEIRMMGAWLN